MQMKLVPKTIDLFAEKEKSKMKIKKKCIKKGVLNASAQREIVLFFKKKLGQKRVPQKQLCKNR